MTNSSIFPIIHSALVLQSLPGGWLWLGNLMRPHYSQGEEWGFLFEVREGKFYENLRQRTKNQLINEEDGQSRKGQKGIGNERKGDDRETDSGKDWSVYDDNNKGFEGGEEGLGESLLDKFPHFVII